MRPSAGGQPANGRREAGDERREVPMALPGRGEVRTRRSPSRAAGWSVGARLAEGGELRARDVGGAL